MRALGKVGANAGSAFCRLLAGGSSPPKATLLALPDTGVASGELWGLQAAGGLSSNPKRLEMACIPVKIQERDERKDEVAGAVPREANEL